VLGYSRRIYVRAFLRERHDDWREGLSGAFLHFGAATQIAVMIDREWTERDNRRLARLLRAAHLTIHDACLENVWCEPGAEHAALSEARRLPKLVRSVRLDLRAWRNFSVT